MPRQRHPQTPQIIKGGMELLKGGCGGNNEKNHRHSRARNKRADMCYDGANVRATMNRPPSKRAQAARRLRKRLETKQRQNAEAKNNIRKPLSWFVGAVVVISALALAIDIIAGLWRWFVDALSGIPLWMMIVAVMVAAYLNRAAKGENLTRKIRKLREIEKGGDKE